MMDLDKLRVFHSVATALSFTRAGEMLNLSQSAISRQISSLEENLHVSLFSRHSRGLTLTEQGEILFRTVSEVLATLASAENALLDSRERPRGPMKITAPVAFGTNWLAPHLREFSDAYPEIILTLLIDDRELDLTKREADVAIRSFPAKHPDLIQKKLTVLNNSIYASNEYLLTHKIPKKPENLQEHRLIIFDENHKHPFAEVNWILKTFPLKENPDKPRFKINSLLGMYQAVESGIGICGLPDYLVHGNHNFSKLLPDLDGPKTDIYLIYPMELRNSKRINVFKEFLLRKLAEDGLGRAR